jgi:hypothetical protein
MKVERIQGNEERRILIGMIVDHTACGRISSKWGEQMFRSRWADVVGGWCVDYFNKYSKAPGKQLQGLFDSWVERAKDKDTVSLVEKFLSSLSGEYEQLAQEANGDYIVDMAAKHFTKVRLQRTLEQAQGDLEDGKLEKAVERVSNFGTVQMGTGAAVDVLNDMTAMQQAFDEPAQDLFTYPGALGHFFRGQMTRSAFVSFLAPEKRGKTFWLMDAGWRAMLARRKVAWFSLGDMSERQMLQRFAVRAARHPIRSKEWPAQIVVPTAIRRHEGILQVRTETRSFDEPLDWRKAYKAMQDVTLYDVKGKEPYLRLASYPNSTLSIRGMDSQLEEWAKEGWVADVVIADYMDIADEETGMPSGYDRRHKIDASWRHARALSQKRHCLFLTATQADAASYTSPLLSRSNFSEAKSKLAHVTGMAGINQTDEEKRKGVFRLNWVALREGEYSEGQTVGVASCLGLGNPAVKSCF